MEFVASAIRRFIKYICSFLYDFAIIMKALEVIIERERSTMSCEGTNNMLFHRKYTYSIKHKTPKGRCNLIGHWDSTTYKLLFAAVVLDTGNDNTLLLQIMNDASTSEGR